MLAACTRDMQFIYVLPGYEGLAHDNRVVRDALSRKNSLRIIQGDESHDNVCDNENQIIIIYINLDYNYFYVLYFCRKLLFMRCWIYRL